MKGKPHKNRRPDSERIKYAEFIAGFIYENGRIIRIRNGQGFKKKSGSVKTDGYHRMKIDGKIYLMHHLVWFWHYKKWPIEIDHIDRDKSNNSIENLRECTRQENQVAALGRPVRCIETGRIYDSLSSAAREVHHKRKPDLISAAIRFNHTSAGYHWEYV